MKRREKLTITLSREEYEKFRILAVESFPSRAGYVRYLVIRYLREIEWDPSKKIR